MHARALFIATELLFLAVAARVGGPPWMLLGTIAVGGVALADLRPGALLHLCPALVWLGLSSATGNRELFFPYAMFLASQLALVLSVAWGRGTGALGGGAIVAAFMAIRTLQRASAGVLAVELAVAIAILLAVFAARRLPHRSATTDMLIAVAASLLAYTSLAL